MFWMKGVERDVLKRCVMKDVLMKGVERDVSKRGVLKDVLDEGC